jgi:hypothetical protein
MPHVPAADEDSVFIRPHNRAWRLTEIAMMHDARVDLELS